MGRRETEKAIAAHNIQTQCCIAGGGPAGLMLGLLLARAGVSVVVLEKHGDFLRDFRGDTIHPSTLELMHELGLLDEFLTLPHQRVSRFGLQFGERQIRLAEFSRLKTRCRFIAMMPQWDFLNFLAAEGAKLETFQLRRSTEVTGLIEQDGRVIGVKAREPVGDIEVRAALVIGADGRSSTVRERAGLKVDVIGAPIDVLWFRLPKHHSDPDETMGRFDRGRVVVTLNRGDYWQCAFVIAKGSAEQRRQAGLAAFQAEIAQAAPFVADRVGALTTWDDAKLLTVRVDRLARWWKPGLLCIGDAAHAMSPVAGVGINLAIQDAVAAANLLAAPLREGRTRDTDLARVQKRRAWAARTTQRLQVAIQNRVIAPSLNVDRPLDVPFVFRLVERLPPLRALAARLIGVGLRPEHIGPALASGRVPGPAPD